jgi:hypothetical protein
MKPHTLLLSALVLAACAPSIDGAAKADLDRRLAAMAPADRDVPAPTAAEPMPLAVGQWIQLHQIDDKGQPSLSTYKITGAEADALWLEVEQDTYYGKSAIRMLVAFGDRTDPTAFDVRRVITRDKNGNTNEMPSGMLGLTKSVYEPILETLTIRWEGMPQEDAQVTAGRFAGCYHGRSTVAVAGHSTSSDVWWHPEVPINGVVKTVGVSDPGTSSQLVDFGTTGATSTF